MRKKKNKKNSKKNLKKYYIIGGVILVLLIIISIVLIIRNNNYTMTNYNEFDIFSDSITFNSNGYKYLDIISSEDEYLEFNDKYGVNSSTNFNFDKYNYAYVVFEVAGCNETIDYKGIEGNKLNFYVVGSCGICSPYTKVFEIELSKDTKDYSDKDIKLDYANISCDNDVVKKPVLYLYPEEDTKVTVNFEHEDKLLTTYPKFNDEWNVLAKSDGTLIDNNGRSYYALYWDESTNHKENFKTGFFVKSEDSIKFLEEKLNEIGFTEREANEFIMYWLPIMEENGDNLVHFEFTDDLEKMNKIYINPEPDSLLRISIEIKKVNKKVKIKEQKMEYFNRIGFSAVQWGGTIYE